MKRRNILSARNELHAGGSCGCCSLWPELFERFRIGYLADIDDIVSPRLALSVEPISCPAPSPNPASVASATV